MTKKMREKVENLVDSALKNHEIAILVQGIAFSLSNRDQAVECITKYFENEPIENSKE